MSESTEPQPNAYDNFNKMAEQFGSMFRITDENRGKAMANVAKMKEDFLNLCVKVLLSEPQSFLMLSLMVLRQEGAIPKILTASKEQLEALLNMIIPAAATAWADMITRLPEAMAVKLKEDEIRKEAENKAAKPEETPPT